MTTMVTVETFCAVFGCNTLVKARHLCPKHYADWQVGRPLPAHADGAGKLQWRSEGDEPVVCNCETPCPDPVGSCTDCGLLVVTYAHGDVNRKVYREQYPDLYERAVALGIVPRA